MKPKVGKPYRWRGHRLLEVPEVGDTDNQCKGCIRDETSSETWIDLCELRGEHDCAQLDDEGNTLATHIFIKDTTASLAEYIARRLE